MANESLQHFTDAAALKLLETPDFVGQWDNLHAVCPWATVFQSSLYAKVWYSVYSHYRPVLFVETTDGQISGLMALAISPGGTLTHVGANQAEYQYWLCSPEFEKHFSILLLKKLLQEYPQKPLQLKYVHHKAPIAGLLQNPEIKACLAIKALEQPIMKIDAEWLNAELKKKNRKEKINRLKRLGDLTFEKVVQYDAFAAVLDELIIQADFRKGSVYGTEFFSSDQYKRAFMLQLFKNGLLHVTLLKLNQEIIAANAGLCGNGIVFLQGLNCHSPIYSKYSPGILRFFMLGLTMHQEGFKEFDLTPGGADGYKSDLATEILTAHVLTIGQPSQIVRQNRKERVKELIKQQLPADWGKALKQNNIRNVKDTLVKRFQARFRFLPKKYNQKLHWAGEPTGTLESKKILRPTTIGTANRISKNSLREFLLFDQANSVLTRHQFLATAEKRLEFGHQAYTLVANGKLTACLWHVPEGSKLLHDPSTKAISDYCFPAVLIDGEVKLIQNFFTVALIEIFRANSALESIELRFKSGFLNVDKLLDNSVLVIQESNSL